MLFVLLVPAIIVTVGVAVNDDLAVTAAVVVDNDDATAVVAVVVMALPNNVEFV